jgi:hypothetical protein
VSAYVNASFYQEHERAEANRENTFQIDPYTLVDAAGRPRQILFTISVGIK